MEKACYCDDLYAAYQSMRLTDLTLKCAPDADGTCLIKVHRLVMGCASQEILEKISVSDSNSLLHLPYTVSTMKILVELAYGRKVAIPPDMMPQLQEATVVLKMNERIRNYVEKYARALANSPELSEDNCDGTQAESHTSRITDGDLTPELFFTPEDGESSPKKNMKTASPIQKNETTRGADSQKQPLNTQDSVQLVQERISLVLVDSSSDEELVGLSRNLNRSHSQTKHTKIPPIKMQNSVGRKNIQTQTSQLKRSPQSEERTTTIEYQNSDSSDDEFMYRSTKLLKREESSLSTMSQPQEEINTQQTNFSRIGLHRKSQRKEGNNLERNINSSVFTSTSSERGSLQSTKKDVEQISNTITDDPRNIASASSVNARQAGSSRTAWCTRAISDTRPLHGDPALVNAEWKILNSIFVDVEERPPRKHLKRIPQLVEILEFKRLENLCDGCFKFQDDIKGHVKSCLKKFKEPRKKYATCQDCGTPFSHSAILRFHICKNKLSEKDIAGFPLDYDDNIDNLT